MLNKLSSKTQQNGCDQLLPWIQSISNHLWWCAATCDGNVVLLREKWKSVLHLIVNKHKGTGNTLFHQCHHRRIPSSEAKNICWRKPGSPAHLALEDVVLNTKLLKDLAKLTDFCRTGKIEVCHSVMLKYCSKQEHKTGTYFLQRHGCQDAICGLSHQCNAERPQALVQSGEDADQKRFKACFPKAHKRWVVKPISQKKILLVFVSLACTSP